MLPRLDQWAHVIPPEIDRQLAAFSGLLRQLLLERDDFLQGVGEVPFLKLQLAFEIGVALFEACHILLPQPQFRQRIV